MLTFSVTFTEIIMMPVRVSIGIFCCRRTSSSVQQAPRSCAPHKYPAFTDGKDTMAGPNRPNPRDISNKLCKSDVVIDSDRFLSPLVYIWGQVRSSGSSPRALCSASGCLLCYLNTSTFRPPFSVHHAQFIDHDFSKSTGGTAGDFVPIPVPKV
jgi:hypothetical protein